MSPEAKQAVEDALAKQGSRKGLLLASAPKANTLAYAAWQALMLNVNPYKASIAGLIMMSDEQRAVYREVEAWWDSMKPAVQAVLRQGLDKDRAALENLGVW